MPTILSSGWASRCRCSATAGRSHRSCTRRDPGAPTWRNECHWEWDFRDPATHCAEDLLGLTMEQCCLDVVRDERWKYVHFAHRPSVLPPLLFDLVADPDQTVNLADDPASAGIRAEYAERCCAGGCATPTAPSPGTSAVPGASACGRDPRV